MTYVIIDTSSILFGLSFNKDVFAIAARRFPGSKPMISRGIIGELRAISKNMGRKGATAAAALSLIRVKNVKVDANSGNVDSWVYRTAARYNNFIVITNDTALFRRVRGANPNVFKLSKSGILKR